MKWKLFLLGTFLILTVLALTETTFSDDFEGTLGKWDENGATAWDLTTTQFNSGAQSVQASNNNEGDLITDDINTSNATSLNISFWFRDDDLDAGDIDLYFFDGTAYDAITESLESLTEDTWHFVNFTTTDSQYFKSNFRVRFNAVIGSGETFWVDDFNVQVTTPSEAIPPNVTINFPQNATYYRVLDMPFTFNVSLNENGSVNYTLDNGTTNVTMNTTDNRNFTAILEDLPDGFYNFKAYSSDVEGNRNNNQSVNFTLIQENIIVNGTVSDASGNEINTTFTIIDESNQSTIYNETNTTHEDIIVPLNSTYTIEVQPLDITTVDAIEFTNISFSEINGTLTEIVNVDEPSQAPGNFTSVFVIYPQLENFTDATVFFTAQANSLFKCVDWNFTSQTCGGNWTLFMKDLTIGNQYNFFLNPGDPGYGIINISNATHLDENKTFVSDITTQAKDLDGVWTETIPDSHYVRIIFENPLSSSNDITIYPRTISGTPKIEVYEKDGSTLLAEFTTINDNQYNQILLTSLTTIQDTFDLRVVDGSVQFDHIVDPQTLMTIYNFSGVSNPNSTRSAFWASPAAPASPFTVAGTEATTQQYTQMATRNTTAAFVKADAANDEPFWRFNFTLAEPRATVQWINVSITGFENASEAATASLWNFSSGALVTIGTYPTSLGNVTLNVSGQNALNFINTTHNTVVVYIQGANFDASTDGDSVHVDYVELRVGYVDQNPQWGNNETNSTTAGETINHSINWTDDFGLRNYTFSFDNGTGTFVNDSPVAFTGTENFSNVVKSVNTTAGSVIRWRVYANDTRGNTNVTSIFNYTTTGAADTEPQWSNNITNWTLVGATINHSVKWTDDTALANYTFSFDNGTGTFVNDSPVVFTGTTNFSNVVKSINTTVGANIRWRVYANDSAGNTNVTSIFTYNASPIVQSTANATSGSQDSITFHFQSNVTVGNVIVVSMVSFDGGANGSDFTNTRGNYTFIPNSNITDGSNSYTRSFWATVNSTGPYNVTINPAGNSQTMTVVAWELKGVNNVSPIDTANATSGSGTVVGTGNLSTAVPTVILGMATQSSSSATVTFTPDSNYTTDQEGIIGSDRFPHNGVHRNIMPVSNGTYKINWTSNTSVTWLTTAVAVRIEGAFPQWNNNTTNSTTAGSSINHSVNWTDTLGLSAYIFSFDNGTGTFVNDSPVKFIGTRNFSNVVKNVNTTAGAAIRWIVYANDTANNTNITSIFTYNTTAAPVAVPQWSSNITNTTLEEVTINHSLRWTDDVALANYTFSFDNGTGTFVNDSPVVFTGTTNFSNVVKSVNTTGSSLIRWMVYANDSSGGTNVSAIFQYTTGWNMSAKPSFEFETNYSDNSLILRINDTHFLNLYINQQGPNNNTVASVLAVNLTNNNLTIRNVSVPFNFGNTSPVGLDDGLISAAKINDTHYLAFFRNSTGAGEAVVLSVNLSGNLAVTNSSPRHNIGGNGATVDGGGIGQTSMAQINDTHYLATFRGVGNSDNGAAIVFVVNLSGNTAVRNLTAATFFETNGGYYHSLQKINDTHYIDVYRGGIDTNASAIVLEVPLNNFSVRNVSVPKRFDVNSADFSTQPINSSHYIVSYAGANAYPYAIILEVLSNFTIRNTTAPTLFDILGTGTYSHTMEKINDSHYLDVYAAGGFGAYSAILEVNMVNATIKNISSLDYQPFINNGYHNLEKLNNTLYINSFQGEDADGFASIITVDVPSNGTVTGNYSLNITSPTTSSPLNVSDGQNVSINFNFSHPNGTFIESDLLIENVTIGGLPATIIGGLGSPGSVRSNGSGGRLVATGDTGITNDAFSVGTWVKLRSDRDNYSDVIGLQTDLDGNGFNLATEVDGTELKAWYPGGSIDIDFQMSVGTWYWVVLSKSSGNVLQIRVFDDSTNTTPIDNGSDSVSEVHNMDNLVLGEGFSGEWIDAEFANAKVQIGVEWTNAEARNESQTYDLQTAGGTRYGAWRLKNTNLNVNGLNDSTTNGRNLTNTGFVNGSDNPLQLGQFDYINNVGWQVNVTAPSGLSGLQHLYVNATYNGITRSDNETNAINYVAANSCTYTSGNWDVLCSDNCLITTNISLGGNNISITGTGTFRSTANITNFTKLTVKGTDSANICRVTTYNGGGFRKS